MRIVVWNCRKSLQKKYAQLEALRPDLAVVPECASPDVLSREAPAFAFADVEWRENDGESHGLGVFAFGDLRLRLHESWSPAYHLFLPIEVRGSVAFNLLAVWAFNGRAKKRKVTANPLTTQDAIGHYESFLARGRSVVAGDFNASVVWDDQKRYAKFRLLDERLRELGLSSAYHHHFDEQLGEESTETYYHTFKRDHSFHIDYAYISTELLPNVSAVTVGSYPEQRPRSDHAPLVIDVEMAVPATPSGAPHVRGAVRT